MWSTAPAMGEPVTDHGDDPGQSRDRRLDIDQKGAQGCDVEPARSGWWGSGGGSAHLRDLRQVEELDAQPLGAVVGLLGGGIR